MKWWLLCAAAAAALMPAFALAQARPDFSGRWEVSQAKSTTGAVGNGATISFGSELAVTQHPAELHVELRHPRSAPMTTIYKLDGSEVTVATPADVKETARATWDGQTLVITATRVVSTQFGPFASETKETWSRAGNVLTIRKTQNADGIIDNETAVYDREP